MAHSLAGWTHRPDSFGSGRSGAERITPERVQQSHRSASRKKDEEVPEFRWPASRAALHRPSSSRRGECPLYSDRRLPRILMFPDSENRPPDARELRIRVAIASDVA